MNEYFLHEARFRENDRRRGPWVFCGYDRWRAAVPRWQRATMPHAEIVPVLFKHFDLLVPDQKSMMLRVPPSLSAAHASLHQISQLLQERYVPILFILVF
jgi:hypothetical protein